MPVEELTSRRLLLLSAGADNRVMRWVAGNLPEPKPENASAVEMGL